MRIKTKLSLNALLSICLGLVVISTLFYAVRRIEDSRRTVQVAAAIVKGVAELESITYDYVAHPEERPRQQWELKYASLGKLLQDEKEPTVVRRIRSSYEGVTPLFTQLVTLNTEGKPTDNHRLLLPETKDRIVAQLVAKTQMMSSDAFLLSGMSGETIGSVLRTSLLVVISSILLLMVAMAGGSAFLSRTIMRSLSGLRKGTETIARGNLDYRIAISGRDELSGLADSFNQMTASLKGVTASKVDLEREIAEREKIEQALRESEQRWATTLSSIGDAVIATDVAGNVTFMNAVAEALTGWALHEAAAKPVIEVFNIVNEQTRRQVENPVTKVLRQGMIVGLANHTILVRKDGTEVPIDDSGAPIRGADGKTMGVVLVFRDITERKQAEERTEHLASYPQLNPNPVIEVDVSGTITFSNPSSQAILGNLGLDKGDLKALLPHDLDAILRDWDKKTDSTLDREVFLAERVFDETIQLVPQFSVARIYARDITERKWAEEALLRAKEAWERTFASVPDLIAILDNQHQVLRVNEAMARRLGVKAEEAVGLRCYQVVHGLSEPPDYCPHSRTIKDGQQHIEEMHEDRLGGDFVVSTTPLHDDRGEMIGTVHVAHDITKRKKAEEALQKAHNELEQRVEERTAEVTLAYEKLETEMAERARVEEQLRQSHKMEAVGTLAGGVAHDFNNILAIMIGFTEMLLDDVADIPDAQHKMEQVLKTGLRGRDLVKQILAFSRKTESARKEISLTSVVKETQALLRSSLPTTIEMRLALETSDDYVLADATEIQQVLMNLATNAADAMRENGGSLTMKLSTVELSPDSMLPDADMAPRTYAKLAVTDTGCGMTEEVRHRIFEPFFTTKERGKGTGMGLAVAYGIVKNHGGTITAQSEAGKGSTFEVYLPRIEKSKLQIQEAKASSPPLGTERILLVDDEELLVEMAKAMLESLGYHVTPSLHPAEALNLFRKDPSLFDLVITDQTMPEMTGLALARQMLGLRKDLLIVLCTGHSETASPEKAQEVGISAFAMKPLVKKELAETIRRVLDNKVQD